MFEFFPNGDFENLDLQGLVEELDQFFQENGAGLEGTIDLLYEDMDRVNQEIVAVLEAEAEPDMQELYSAVLEWSQHAAHLIYYVGIDHQAQAPENFTEFVLNIPALQMMISYIEESGISPENLQRLATGWMEIREDTEIVLDQLSQD